MDTTTTDSTSDTTTRVTEGATVVLSFVDDGFTLEARVSAIWTDPGEAVFSPDSPCGHAILGRSAGERVTFDGPEGAVTVQILAVRAG